ncbi:hypothetical protein EUZ85_15855 [Hahella sp. KA22]|uniref:hypothetical protein n=1 Tax=Hahella sp. KA22 TaxID=1628392 RepID=UPI000FDEC886|nr:hypothetical protein [Hahella sp. KA22]AZZ92121.1 hypothetical protein ENC22_13290 [Hahella sp. KA22]QAY55492.1 hypothetical protein EUZ85_15855 [Hahella sp. KA22]
MFQERSVEISSVLPNPNIYNGKSVRLRCIFSQFCGEDDAYLIPGDVIDASIDAEKLYNAKGAIKVDIKESLAVEICDKAHVGTLGIPYDFIDFCEIEGILNISAHIDLVLTYLKLPGNRHHCSGDFEYKA